MYIKFFLLERRGKEERLQTRVCIYHWPRNSSSEHWKLHLNSVCTSIVFLYRILTMLFMSRSWERVQCSLHSSVITKFNVFGLQGCMRLECILLMSATLLNLGVHWIMRPAEGRLAFTLCKRYDIMGVLWSSCESIGFTCRSFLCCLVYYVNTCVVSILMRYGKYKIIMLSLWLSTMFTNRINWHFLLYGTWIWRVR